MGTKVVGNDRLREIAQSIAEDNIEAGNNYIGTRGKDYQLSQFFREAAQRKNDHLKAHYNEIAEESLRENLSDTIAKAAINVESQRLFPTNEESDDDSQVQQPTARQMNNLERLLNLKQSQKGLLISNRSQQLGNFLNELIRWHGELSSKQIPTKQEAIAKEIVTLTLAQVTDVTDWKILFTQWGFNGVTGDDIDKAREEYNKRLGNSTKARIRSARQAMDVAKKQLREVDFYLLKFSRENADQELRERNANPTPESDIAAPLLSAEQPEAVASAENQNQASMFSLTALEITKQKLEDYIENLNQWTIEISDDKQDYQTTKQRLSTISRNTILIDYQTLEAIRFNKPTQMYKSDSAAYRSEHMAELKRRQKLIYQQVKSGSLQSLLFVKMLFWMSYLLPRGLAFGLRQFALKNALKQHEIIHHEYNAKVTNTKKALNSLLRLYGNVLVEIDKANRSYNQDEALRYKSQATAYRLSIDYFNRQLQSGHIPDTIRLEEIEKLTSDENIKALIRGTQPGSSNSTNDNESVAAVVDKLNQANNASSTKSKKRILDTLKTFTDRRWYVRYWHYFTLSGWRYLGFTPNKIQHWLGVTETHYDNDVYDFFNIMLHVLQANNPDDPDNKYRNIELTIETLKEKIESYQSDDKSDQAIEDFLSYTRSSFDAVFKYFASGQDKLNATRLTDNEFAQLKSLLKAKHAEQSAAYTKHYQVRESQTELERKRKLSNEEFTVAITTLHTVYNSNTDAFGFLTRFSTATFDTESPLTDQELVILRQLFMRTQYDKNPIAFSQLDHLTDRDIISPLKKCVDRLHQRYGGKYRLTKTAHVDRAKGAHYEWTEARNVTYDKWNRRIFKKFLKFGADISAAIVALGQGVVPAAILLSLGMAPWFCALVLIAATATNWYLCQNPTRDMLLLLFVGGGIFKGASGPKKVFIALTFFFCVCGGVSMGVLVFQSALGITFFVALGPMAPFVLGTIMGFTTFVSMTSLFFVLCATLIKDDFHIKAWRFIRNTFLFNVDWNKLDGVQKFEFVLLSIFNFVFVMAGLIGGLIATIPLLGFWHTSFISFITHSMPAFIHFSSRTAMWTAAIIVYIFNGPLQLIFNERYFIDGAKAVGEIIGKAFIGFMDLTINLTIDFLLFRPDTMDKVVIPFLQKQWHTIKVLWANAHIPQKSYRPIKQATQEAGLVGGAVPLNAMGNGELAGAGAEVLQQMAPVLSDTASKTLAIGPATIGSGMINLVAVKDEGAKTVPTRNETPMDAFGLSKEPHKPEIASTPEKKAERAGNRSSAHARIVDLITGTGSPAFGEGHHRSGSDASSDSGSLRPPLNSSGVPLDRNSLVG